MAPNVGLGTQGPEQRGWGLWIVSVVGVLLAACFVCARLAQRHFKSKMGLDDYVIIAALVASGLLSMCECQAVVYGYGRRWHTLDLDTRHTARKWFYGAQIMYKTVLALNKVAVVCLYYRLFAVSSIGFRRACHATNGFIILSNLAFIVGTVFQCQPIPLFWDKSIKGGKCFNEEPWWISYSVIQILTDVALLALPLKQVLSLTMSKPEKIGLCFVFGTGLFVTFTSIFRACTVSTSADDHDPTWGPIPATIWSVVEANAGIICACLPMLRHPFLRLFGPLIPSNQGRSNRQSFRLTSRTNHRSAVFSNGKQCTDLSETMHDDMTRESEEQIIALGRQAEEGGAAGLPVPGKILVKSEVTITRKDDEEAQAIDRELHIPGGRSGATSATDDRGSSTSTYMHV